MNWVLQLTLELESDAGEVCDIANSPIYIRKVYDDLTYLCQRMELPEMNCALPGKI